MNRRISVEDLTVVVHDVGGITLQDQERWSYRYRSVAAAASAFRKIADTGQIPDPTDPEERMDDDYISMSTWFLGGELVCIADKQDEYSHYTGVAAEFLSAVGGHAPSGHDAEADLGERVLIRCS
jgi:hypothetical protein